jgi:hypothetical protein
MRPLRPPASSRYFASDERLLEVVLALPASRFVGHPSVHQLDSYVTQCGSCEETKILRLLPESVTCERRPCGNSATGSKCSTR